MLVLIGIAAVGGCAALAAPAGLLTTCESMLSAARPDGPAAGDVEAKFALIADGDGPKA